MKKNNDDANNETPFLPTSRWELVTPEKAKEYKARNTDRNRPFKQWHANFLAGELKAGRFKVNGDAIRFDYNGRMMDGQHRIDAIIQSGVPLRCLIVENLEPEAIVTIDLGGSARSISDIFAMNGETSAKALTGALTAIYRYEHEDYPAMQAKVSFQVLDALLKTYPQIREISRRATASSGTTFLKGAVGSLLLFYGAKHGVLLDNFWHIMQTGAGAEINTGCYWLRERLIRLKTQNNTMAMRTGALLAITIKAWNADVMAKPVRMLRWSPEEPFPRFI